MTSWVEELPSGRWQARYTLPDGRKRSAGTFPHKAPARKAAVLAEAQAATLGWRDPQAAMKTWGEWCDDWWPTRPVEAGTLKRDVSPRDKHLLPRWGTVPLIDITRHDIRAWGAALSKTGLAPATVRRHLHLFSASLTAAVDAEIILANPAYRLALPSGQATHGRYLTHEELDRVCAKMPDPAWETITYFLANTGLRWGEAAGLMWNRIDRQRGVILVAETWDEATTSIKAYPKGKRRRTVTLPPWLGDMLEPGDPVLKAARGGRPNLSNYARVLNNAAKEAGVAHFRPHDLRHTLASWLLQDGISLAEVGRVLGHTSVQTTARYAHLAEVPTQQILDALPAPRRGDRRAFYDNITGFRATSDDTENG